MTAAILSQYAHHTAAKVVKGQERVHPFDIGDDWEARRERATVGHFSQDTSLSSLILKDYQWEVKNSGLKRKSKLTSFIQVQGSEISYI